MPSYVPGILVQGNCPALVRGGVFSAGGADRIVWDKSGLTDIRSAVRAAAKQSRCSSARAFLMTAVLAASAAAEADDWLIPQECLDMSAANVWYDKTENRIRFCLAEDGWGGSFFGLLLELAASEAPEAVSYIVKLADRAQTEHLSFAAIKKELSQRLTGPG